MAKLDTTQRLVYEALLTDPLARDDDYILIYDVLRNYVSPQMSLGSVFMNNKQLGIPSAETITRCRRKLLETHPELCSDKTKEKRRKEEAAFIEYAINN